MPSEDEKNYEWALTALKKVLKSRRNDVMPRFLVSDNDSALLNAEQQVFLNSTRLLCRWHINKNVVARCKVHFTNGDEWEEMIADWSALSAMHQVSKFSKNNTANFRPSTDIPLSLRATWIERGSSTKKS